MIAIDPGSEESGFVVMSAWDEILEKGKIPNEELRQMLQGLNYEHVVIEMISSYGFAVGQTVFDTCVWIGRFAEASVNNMCEENHTLVYRKDVKLHHCGATKANDSNVRRVVMDRYPRIGGGKSPEIGIKSKPGPLFGFSKDMWQALAVGLWWFDTVNDR